MRRLMLIVVAALTSICFLPVPIAQARQLPRIAPGIVDTPVLMSQAFGVKVAAGRLVDAAGRPAAGTIALIAWPNEAWNRTLKVGDKVPTPTVGWGRARADGSFVLNVDPALITSDYYNTDGRVNLEAIGWTDRGQGSWTFPAVIGTAGKSSTQTAPDITIHAATPIAAPHSVSDRLQTGTNTAPDVGDICSWSLQSTSDRWTVIGWSWPYGSDTGWMESGASHSVTLGAAVSSTGNYGGWSASGSTTATSGVSFEWAESVAYRDFRVGERYGKFRLWCSSSGWHNSYKEQQTTTTGGFITASLGSPPNYTSCAPVSPGLWQRINSTGNSWSLSAGVKISSLLGIDLSVTTNYDSNRILKYRLVATGKVCGSSDPPSLASNVKTSR